IQEKEDRCRFQELIDKFISLNEAYLHWQLLDDVADVPKDTNDGLVTAPGYILIAQRSLAKVWLEEHSASESNAPRVSRWLSETSLLCDWFKHSPLFERAGSKFQHQKSAVHCSLANTVADLGLSLEELSMRRIDQGRRYAAAMNSRSWREAIQCL